MREVEPAPLAKGRPTTSSLTTGNPSPSDPPAHAPTRLRVRPEVRVRLTTTARQALPAEACGLLFGTRGGDEASLDEAVPMRNRADDPQLGFALDPIEVAAAIAAGERRGRTWLGFFHSHPRGGAGLSPLDRAQGWPHCVQLVVAADTGEVRAHWIETAANVLAVAVEPEVRS